MTLTPISTLTKLDVVNRILQEVGERTVSAITDNTPSWKVAGLLYSAINVVNNELPWEELIQNILISDATVETSVVVLNGLAGYNFGASASNILEIISVFHSVTKKPVKYMEWHNVMIKGFAQAATTTHWTFYRGLLYTYPQILLANRDDYIVTYTGSVSVPDGDTDLFAAPDYLVELYIKRLLFQFITRHVGNPQLALPVQQEYVVELEKYAAKYKITPKTLRTGLMVPNTNYMFQQQQQQ